VEELVCRQIALCINYTKCGRQPKTGARRSFRKISSELAAAGFLNAGFAPEKVSTSTHIRFIGPGSWWWFT
jgi:hypothetical protein